MAFTFKKSKSNKIKVIVSKDDAIGNIENYEKYIESFSGESPNEDLLELKPGLNPSRFVLLRSLSHENRQKLRSKYMIIKGGDENRIDINYSYEELRMSLVGIENPDDTKDIIPFKRADDGLCSRKIIDDLEDSDVFSDLVNALKTAQGKISDDLEKEKN